MLEQKAIQNFKRVLVISVDQTEATFRLRMAILRDLLSPRGFEFDFRTRPAGWLERRRLVSSAKNYDAVIIQRKLLDPSHARLLRRKAKKVFFDLDDAIMRQRREIGRVSTWLKHRRFLATAKATDRVVAGNPTLAEEFRQLGCEVTILPTMVRPDDYRVKQHVQTDSPALVWIGSKSTLPYLQQWMPAIERASEKVRKLRVITIANDTVKSDRVKVEHIPWTLEGEADALVSGDIGIAPTPIDPWTIGKCGFKIIQYMASGLPVIASPVGLNSEIVEHGVNGFLADTDEQWIEAIERLTSDRELRHQMGEAGRQKALREFDVRIAGEVWEQLLS